MRRCFTMCLALFAAAACSDPLYVSERPPTSGGGGFTSTIGGGTGAYGSGASGQGGSGGEPTPCHESLRRCAREVAYADAGETTVEVRGNFAPDGWTNGVPLAKAGSTWSAIIDVPWGKDVEYKLLLNGSTWIADPANPEQVDDGFGGKNSVMPSTTCPDDYTCAPPTLGDFDWRDAVLYFVLVDRFANGDPGNDGPAIAGVQPPASYQGGDWAGVLSRIQDGYFDDLGVNALWLSVPVDNADGSGVGDDGHQYSAYHGYWPKDLGAAETRFGAMADLQALVDEAHARGIKIVLDYAMNHVHSSSPVFAQHPDWFWPLDNGGKTCVCGGECSWDGAEGRRCWFRDYLPDFNFTNTQARNFSVGNAIEWAQGLGIDGLRLDAVKHIEESWLLDLRARISSDIETVTQQHFYLVGETFTGERDVIGDYVDPATKLDGQFDFPMRAALIASVLTRSAPMSALDAFIGSNVDYYGAGIMSTFVGNHDVPRAIHFAQDAPLWSDVWDSGKDKSWSGQPGLPGGTSAFERLANAFTVLYTLPGVPLIYYGDEVAMPGAGDPDNRRFMQWSSYSAGQLLVKAHVSKLGAIRKAHSALRRGKRTSLGAEDDTMLYRMEDGSDVVTVAVNRGDSAQTIGGLPPGSYTDELSGQTTNGASVGVPARSARILVAQ